MMETCDDQRGIHKAEDRGENDLQRSGDTSIHDGGDHRTDLPADGTEDEVRRHDSEGQAEEGHKDHRYHRGNDFPEKLFQINQGEGRQHGGNDLRLIADHIDLGKTKVPLGDVRSRCCRHCVGVQELAGDQGHTKDQAQHFRGAHLFGDGPADTDRDTDVEDSFTDQPEEMVNACPELGELDQGVAALENIETVDTVSEAQDQTAGDDRGQEWCKDLRKYRRQTLQRILILF